MRTWKTKMIAKEWWDSWWKPVVVGVVAVGALLLGGLPTPYAEIEKIAAENANPRADGIVVLDGTASRSGDTVSATDRREYREAVEAMGLPTDPVKMALDELWVVYSAGGGAAMALLAGLLGISLVSEEARRNTIVSLLSKPISRRRLLLTKYAVCAGVLLLAATSGGVVLATAAGFKGYPLEELSVVGSVLSVVLLWLGSLFVLGVALVFSVTIRNLLVGVGATLAALVLLSPDQWTSFSFWNQFPTLGLQDRVPENLTVLSYWSSGVMYLGERIALTNFLVCLAAAALPLLAALWLFNNKAY